MNKIDEKAAELTTVLENELGEIEMKVLTEYTLADAIREGCKVTDQAYTWGNGDTACAMSAAVIAATARGYMV
jgi:hypothetical protein